MKFLLIGCCLFLLFVFIIIWHIKKRKAIRKVKCMCTTEKICGLDAILEPFGFQYNLHNDIIVSRNDAWQKKMGYHNLYDLKAPFFNIVMDAEPIYFVYQDKKYRLEFWKGQYGLTTGAEIGLYVKDECSLFEYYRAATKEEELNMKLALYKKCKLFKREDCTWWLTGFDVGRFSRLRSLKLISEIEFPCEEMRDAFICGLLEAGYARSKISICDNKVAFEFCCSKNRKLNHHYRIIKLFAQIANYINCKIYQFLTRPFITTLDKLTYLRFRYPCIYKLFIKKCVSKCRCYKHKRKEG